MGLKQTVQKAAQRAIKALGDLPTAMTYVKVSPGAYNPATGLTADAAVVNYPLVMPLLRLLDHEVTWFPAPAKMMRIPVPELDLPVTPGRNDYFLIAGVRWEIKRVNQPGGVIVFYVESP